MLNLTNSLLTKNLKEVRRVFAAHDLNKAVKPVFDLWVTRVIEEAMKEKLPQSIAIKQQKNAAVVAKDPYLQALDKEVAKQLELSKKPRI